MKRSELKAGMDVYHARERDWEAIPYRGEKATVVDTAAYKSVERWHRRRIEGEDPWEKSKSGTRVLVDITSREGRVTRTVVPLSHLHGPYEEVRAQVQEQYDARQARARKVADAKQERVDRRDKALARAREAGVLAHTMSYPSNHDAFVAVSVEELERVLNLLQVGGVR